MVDRALVSLVSITCQDIGLCLALSSNVLPALLKLISLPDLAFQVARVICNIAAHPQGKRECANLGVVEALAPLLVDNDTELRRVVSGAIMHIAVCEEGKVNVEEFASDNLVACLSDTNPHVKRNALSAIRYTCEYPKARETFFELLKNMPEILAVVKEDILIKQAQH